MDVQMPGMDGYTVTRQMRINLKLDTPVIAMTAHAFAGEREKCLSFGMNEYLAKPIDGRELYRLITQFAGVYRYIDLQYMRGISEGNKEYEKTVTEQFIEVIPLDIDTLESALAGGDEGSIRHAAHSMRSDVAIMGLLEQVQSYLDVLEYEPFEEIHFRKIVSGVKAICLEALPEARRFYDSL
jgi:CheY-like chemotaxis protein